MPAHAATAAQTEAVPASQRTITDTASVGQHASSLPTAQARRRRLAEIPQSADTDTRRRAQNPVAKTAGAMDNGLSSREFWIGALGLNLIFWLWALYGA